MAKYNSPSGGSKELSDDEKLLPGTDEVTGTVARGFAPDQMVTCEECLRANPPTRATCLYCAAPLPRTQENAALLRPTLRRLEKWERGFNVILLTGAEFD